MADKTPAEITPGNASRGSVVHASDAAEGDLSRSHAEEDISRLQSAVISYSSSLTYEVGDFILESTNVYRCITQITVPEVFNAAKWEQIDIAQTPWTSNIDGGQFNLSNVPLIEMQADGNVELEMFRNTNPAVSGFIGQINFDARKTTGGKFTWGRIQHSINDPAPGTASSEMQFQVRQADSLIVFMTINEGNADRIRFFRTVNVHETNLTFDETLSVPGSGTAAIYLQSDALVFNVPGARGFEWSIADTNWMTIDPTDGVTISTSASQKIGFFGVTPVGPQSPAATSADIITALETLGLFI